MRIVYYDESGDDGYPTYSSPLFILTAVYIHYLKWKENFETILEFRRRLKTDFKIPVKMEMHTRHFLLNKNPYKELNIGSEERLKVISLYCKLIANLDLKIINTVIVKTKIRNPEYSVLDTALTYSIQRIENDLNPVSNPDERFMIITDTGRVGKMRKTARKRQKINYIPSKFSEFPYRREIKSLVEDPLPKESQESYFIQIADLVSYIVNLYTIKMEGISDYSKRLIGVVDEQLIINWLDELKSVLNLKASSNNDYGIVFHPK